MPYSQYIILFLSLLTATLTIPQSMRAQNTVSPVPVALTDLTAFKPTAGNWQVVKQVFFDPTKEGKPQLTAGTGVVVNQPTEKKRDHLLTNFEHGDLELELDFMLAKNSNSGIYLQGRYEVQLLDSWGVANPKYSDCGGIYERWDEKRPAGRQGYEGRAPAQNVSKAPGLWQHFRIVFRAPRFNQQGQKIENARFVKVIQNGVTVQENVEVTGPTRSAAFTDKKPLGPLMLQGDHGAVAVRNISYRAYGAEQVTLSDLKLTAYDGKFKTLADFATAQPAAEMDLDVLAHLAPASRDEFAGKITGTVHVPVAGPYTFDLNLAWIPLDTNPDYINGAGELNIAGKKVLTVTGKTGVATGSVTLEKGTYPLVLTYFKSSGYWYARSNDITLAVGGPGVAYTALRAPLRVAEPVGAITLTAQNEPVMQRGFVDHQGKKRTHTISVGEPGQVNYTVDLSKGEFLQIWRGNFLETTPMWYGRGETQLEVPLGSVIQFSGKPSLTFLADQNAAWPDSNAAYTNLGYNVNQAGRPVFKYTLGGAQVKEFFEPEDGGKKLAHTFTVTPGPEKQEIWCRVAAGNNITLLPNGLYAVNDQQYFIQLTGKEKPLIRSTAANGQEMLLPVRVKDNVGTVKYAIVW